MRKNDIRPMEMAIYVRKVYSPPAVQIELDLETRAGSPLRLPPDLIPGSGPAGIEK